MSSDKQAPQHSARGKHPLLLTVISGLSFVALLILMFFVGEGFDTLEERLRYEGPDLTQTLSGGAYGIEMTAGQTVYVPAYSHIYSRGGKPHLLETTLSIRNSNPEHSIWIQSVRYYNTAGSLVENYLDGKLQLGPLETTEFLVEKHDTRGGSGANFIVIWSAAQPVYEPIIEAVMIGITREHTISLLSPGRPLVKPTD